MPELEFENLDDLLAAFGKKTKPERSPNKPVASKPKQEDKAFVAFHFSSGQREVLDFIGKRDPMTQAFLNIFMRPNETWQAVLSAAKDEARYHPNYLVVAHDHAFNEPCQPAAKAKCREIKVAE